MKFKIWDDFNKIMYFNAENIDDPKWNFARLHHNKHCTTCVSVGKLDKNNSDIYTYDMLKIHDLVFYVKDLEDGETKLELIGMNNNIKESLKNFKSEDIEIVGSYLELE